MSQILVTGEAKIRDIQGPVVANSGVITALDGAASQYVRGDGTLADFPTSSGGGSSVSYYLNSSVSQGTIGGVAYRELSKDPIIGAGTDIPISTNGYVANYITDVNDPDVVLVPGGNFNCEFYFSVNNNTGNPTTYAELYKYDGTTFTLLGTSAGVPESINQGTTIAPYYFAIPVATAALSVTDRLAIRIYVNVDGRTVTLHTENGHLCQVVTTLSKGMVSLNNLTDQSQYLATGTSGTNFAIVSSGDTHTFNLPVASATNTGKLSSTDWSTFNNKQNALTNPITGTGASGQVTFFNGTTSVIGSNNFFWDNTNSFLGVGTNVPSAGVTSFSTTPAFQFKAAGTAPAITFSNTLTSASLACVFGLATANNQFITGTAAGDMAIANQSTSAGAIVFGTGTTERMRMTSAGTLSIGNTNSTYKLDVTGIVRFTGELTGSSAVFSSTVRPASSFTSDLGTSSFRWNDIYGFSLTLTSSVTALSLIKSGGTSSQFLMADGSVNTSVLPSGAYLPLTGGTLTGALSGTSASFSSSATATAFIPTGSSMPTNGMYLSGTNTLGFATNSTLDMVLNATGNLGLGVTPASNWGRVGFEIGVAGASITREVRDLVLLSNSIWTSTGLVYAAGAGAGRFDVGVSSFRWYTAPTGTAGNAISFTQAMTLDNNGSLGIGTTSLTGITLGLGKTLTGATDTLQVNANGIIQSDSTNTGTYFRSTASTVAATFTLGSVVHYRASQGTFGAGSTITNQYGVLIDSTLIGATNNYGFFGNIASGTNRWNLYMNGTASNYLAGKLLIGSTTDNGAALQVTGAATFSSSLSVPTATISSSITSPMFRVTPSGTFRVNTDGDAILGYMLRSGAWKGNAENNLGFATDGAYGIAFFTNGSASEKMIITSGGNVGIGTSSPNDKLVVDGGNNIWSGVFRGTTTASQSFGVQIFGGTNSSDTAFRVLNGATSSTYFLIRGDGYLQSPSTYNNTTASPNYLSISSSGFFERFVASSARYKEEIKDWDVNGLDIILALRPRTYKYKKEYYNKADVDFLGLIAEEVAEVNTYLADYENEDGTGQVENVRYATIVVPLIKAIQELEARIKQLENK